jgi:glucose/arabinose dehydrogenase
VSRRRIALVAAACGLDYLLWMLTSASGPEPLALIFGVLLTVLVLALIVTMLSAFVLALLSGWPGRLEARRQQSDPPTSEHVPAAAPEPFPVAADDLQHASQSFPVAAGSAALAREYAAAAARSAPAGALRAEGEGPSAALLQEAALGRVELSAQRPQSVGRPPAKHVSA